MDDVKSATISDEIVDRLRDDIVSGYFKPRERLIEAELSERYNTSRTPIREAIKKLEAGGLVKVKPYHGAVVTDVDINEIKDIYEARVILEGQVTMMAAQNITVETLNKLANSIKIMEKLASQGKNLEFGEENERFHRYIFSSCENKYIVKLIEEMLEKTAIFRRMSWQTISNLNIAIKGHKEIYNAIKKGDAEKARELSGKHIRLYLTEE